MTSSAPTDPHPDVRLTPGTAFGIYVHVPFCATRCGYCDFNTYTAGELGGATPQGWLAAVRAELAMAAGVVGQVAVDTVFVGGGTPSLLGGEGLAAVLDAVRDNFALAADAEVTTEANPESTSPEFFEGIRAAGYTRVSLGMQSAAPAVLKILDRTHSPGRAMQAAAEALAAACRARLKEGATLEGMLARVEGFLAAPALAPFRSLEAWPQHSSREEMELMLAASDDVLAMSADHKDAVAAELSRAVFGAVGRLMLAEAWEPSSPVRWLNHDVIARRIVQP